MNRQRGFIAERDFLFFMVALVLLGVLAGGVLFVGVPWLWDILRPLIQGWTAP